VLTITEAAFDANAVYTVTYPADDSATTVDLKDIPSTPLLEPEVFGATDRNNRIELSYYPYVEYAIVNDASGYWDKPDDREALWRFSPSVPNRTSLDGTRITFTSLRDFELDTGSFGDLTGVDLVCLHAEGDTRTFKATLTGASSGRIEEDFEGDTGVPLGYEIGECKEIDGQLFGLSRNSYEPVSVFVDDQKAVNITAYEDFEHPAFLPGEPGRKHQYIHAGRFLYFSTPVADAKIEVSYRWRTQYLRLVARLRSNLPIFTEVTPKLVDARLKLKTTRL
jgi:hypothetical protein